MPSGTPESGCARGNVPSLRALAVRLHRYAGVLLAIFLILSGATGSMLAFHAEIDRYLNPAWFAAKTRGTALPLSTLIAAVEARYPSAYVNRVTLPQLPDSTLRLSLAPRSGSDAAAVTTVNQVYVDPASGEILGARNWGALRLDRAHLVPFVYELHHRLHLGAWGAGLLGGVAIVWVLDCFVGLYLAWPRPAWAALRRALGVKWRAGRARLHYDVHRAGGLWFWPVLLILALSGVYLNLGQEIFRPTLALFTELTSPPDSAMPTRPNPAALPALDWDAALARAAQVLPGARLGEIRYTPATGVYRVGFHTEGDISTRYPGTLVYVAGESGRVLGVQRPNAGTAGDVILEWQFPLHSGQAFGLAGRALIALAGLAAAVLSVTGIVIWRRKCVACARRTGCSEPSL